MKKCIYLLSVAALYLTLSCVKTNQLANLNSGEDSDISWYLNPENNNATDIYGFGEGRTLEQATKSALSDASARLSVSISSTSNLLLEENELDTNSEFRKKITQNIDAIQFPNFETVKSGKKEQNIYIQVKINRSEFVNLQNEKINFLKNKIKNLTNSVANQNIIKKRNSYQYIIKLAKKGEILVRIVHGANNGELKSILKAQSDAENKLSRLSDNYDFYFKTKSDVKIYSIISKYLNRQGVSISTVKNNSDNQIVMDVKSSQQTNKIYGSYITKLTVDFSNFMKNKIVATNKIEVSGSSTIGRNESYSAAIKSLDEKIKRDGVFKVLGLE